MKKTAKILVLLLALSLSVFIVGCGKDKAEKAPTNDVPKEEAVNYCPLDHAVVDNLPERVLAVAVDNGPNSEPQTNLGKADLLFELPVEGGINRFLALYYHNQPDTIGPVRSARHCFISLVNSFGAIYVHCGASYMFTNLSDTVDEIDQMAMGSYFWRDNSRKAPVNLYTSWEKLQAAATEKGLWEKQNTTKFAFYNDKAIKALTKGTNTDINIAYTYKPVSYKWDDAANHYMRFSKGAPHMDAADNTQLYADNVVVMKIAAPLVTGDTKLLDMKFAGNSSSGVLFQNGTATDITWSMKDEISPLTFTMANGKQAKFLPGRTIIQVVPDTVNVEYNGGETAAASSDAQ